jgi:ATP-binding cassette subfamily C (CFTR/MRP) protein 4
VSEIHTPALLSFVSLLAALDGGLVGMSVSSALALMGMFQWAIRQSAEVENLVSL